MSRRFRALSPRIALAPNWHILVACYPLALYVSTYKSLRDCKYRSLMSLVGVGWTIFAAILPRRFGGIAPGISPVLEAAYVAPAMQFEASIDEYV